MNTLQKPPVQATHAYARRGDFLPALVKQLNLTRSPGHRYLLVAHLFDDTMRMIDALSGVVEFDAIVGVPYSSGSEATRRKWQARYGCKVACPGTEEAFLDDLKRVLKASFDACRRSGQKLVVQEVGGYVVELLGEDFRDQLNLVEGVIEITKQGVWRASRHDLKFPVLHCADSELKRLEATRCGETIARCLDGLMRDLGNSLAGRHAAVFGAGWIGSGVARGLRRLDVVPALVDPDPLKVAEARLSGFDATLEPGDLGRCDLVVGAAGCLSVTSGILDRLRSGCLVASASSRRIEIDVGHLEKAHSYKIHPSIRAFQLAGGQDGKDRQICLVNDGYPANFIPGSGSVADEIVELILGELIVLMADLTTYTYEPGIHRLDPEGEAACTRLWIAQRDAM